MKDQYAIGNEEKKRIFDVAISIMEEMGYEKMSIRAICAKADISTGAFYHYFGSKQEVLRFYYEEAVRVFRADVEVKLEGLPFREQLINFYTWYAEYTAKFGVEFVMHYFNNQNQALNCTTYNNEIINITDSILQRAVQNGYVIPYNKNIHDVSVDMCVIVKGAIFDWCVRKGAFSLSEYINDLLSRCLKGLLP